MELWCSLGEVEDQFMLRAKPRTAAEMSLILIPQGCAASVRRSPSLVQV